MQGKRHDRVVEMWLCFFSGKVDDYKVQFESTRKCRSTPKYMAAVCSTTLLLAFPAGLGNYGIVLSFSVSLFTAAVLFFSRFIKVTRQQTRVTS